MRQKLRSHTRLSDNFKVGMLSILFSTFSILAGIYAFAEQGCVTDFFEENSICKPCREFVDPFCSNCHERFSCDYCDRGHYPIDNTCLSCAAKDPLCVHCDASGCLECSSGFFVSLNKCTSCEMIKGCMAGMCFSDGCHECEVGFYLDDGQCKPCASAISGCKQCKNADVCTDCASEYLTIEGGRCHCRAGEAHQFTDINTGACECEPGYYMTTRGCRTCDYMIPGCLQCDIVSYNTGIPLYGAARFLSESQYLTCFEC